MSKAAEERATRFSVSLPCTLSIPLLNTMVKTEQFPDILTAIKMFDKVLEVQKADQVKTYLKAIMLGLLKVKVYLQIYYINFLSNYRLMTMKSPVCGRHL